MPACADGKPSRGAEIVWDHAGVAHVYAASDVAGFKALGWAQMKTHGDRILELYGRARGRSAEYWGEQHVATDELTRRLGFPGLAQRWLTSLPNDQRANLNAFVEGMNAYARAHRDQIAADKRVVLPISPADPLAHLYQIIHGTFMSGADLAVARSLAKPAEDQRAGSNAYAIAPSRSASGRAMLVINPHLPWSDLFTWFEVQLDLPSQSVYGVSLIGMPFVGIGFSEAGGWTHTVNEYDGADIYRLVLRDSGYVLDGAARPFDVATETLRVRLPDGSLENRTLTIRRSAHGPVIAENNNAAFAVRLAGLESFGMLRQYWDMAAARNLDEFESAQRRLQMPFFNTIYANRDGDIYYLHGGVLPDRRSGDFDFWKGVIPGDRSEFIWNGTLGYEALPRFKNPPGGFIQNANDPPWLTTYPAVLQPQDYVPFIASRVAMAWRPQHSLRQVVEDQSITFEELVAMKQSTRLEMADRFLPDLLQAAAASTDAEVVAARQVLAAWDRRTDADSRGALLFMTWGRLLLKEGDRAYAERWRADQPYTTPRGLADPTHAVDLLRTAAASVRKTFGALDVSYGQGYRLRINGKDLSGSGGPSDLGSYRTSFGKPGPDGVAELTSGDSFAAVVEFGPRLRAEGLLTYGTSSQPGSPHYGDQQTEYAAKRLRPLWFYPADVRANAASTERIP